MITKLFLELLLLVVKLLDGVCQLFDILIGTKPVNYIAEDGTGTSIPLLDWFLGQDIVVQVFLTLFVIAVVFIAVCCIAAIIKSMFHSGDGERKPATKVIGQGLRSLITTVMIAIITVFAIGGANTFLGVIDTTFSNAGDGKDVSLSRIVLELGVVDGQEMDLTTMEYVKHYQMHRVMGSVDGVQDGYRTETDIQDKLDKHGNIWDDENKVWRWTIMQTSSSSGLKKNLDGLYKDGYLKPGVTVDEIWGSYGFWLLPFSEWWNNDNAYINVYSYNLLIPFVAVIVLIFVLVMTSFTLVKRLFDILALFFVLPVVNATVPLDDGAHMKLWRETMISKVLLAYGAVFAMGVFKIFAPFCNMVRASDATLTQVLRLLLICGAGLSIQGGMFLFSRLVGTGIAEGGEMGQSARTLLYSGLGAAHLLGALSRGGARLAGNGRSKGYPMGTPPTLPSKTGTVGKNDKFDKNRKDTGQAYRGGIKGRSSLEDQMRNIRGKMPQSSGSTPNGQKGDAFRSNTNQQLRPQLNPPKVEPITSGARQGENK